MKDVLAWLAELRRRRRFSAERRRRLGELLDGVEVLHLEQHVAIGSDAKVAGADARFGLVRIEFVGGDLVFTNDGRRGLVAWSAIKRELDAAVGKIDRWTIHDLRRTARSNWSALGVAPHIAEMMLGHKQPGIVGVYDTHRYEQERRAALELWARRIADIVAPPPETGNVVKMRA